MVAGHHNLPPFNLTVDIPQRTESHGADSLDPKHTQKGYRDVKNVDTPDVIFGPKDQFKFGPNQKKV